jgi:phage tail-like protein
MNGWVIEKEAVMSIIQSTSSISSPTPETLTPLSDVYEIPIPIYQFSIEIGDAVVALFQSLNGMSVSREVEPLNEGGVNHYGYEFPAQVSYSHVTFETGLSSSDFFWKWMMAGQYDGRAQALDFFLVQRRSAPTGTSPIFEEVHRWNFHNAFPVSWSISDLNVDETDHIAIETLELSFDYFELIAV